MKINVPTLCSHVQSRDLNRDYYLRQPAKDLRLKPQAGKFNPSPSDYYLNSRSSTGVGGPVGSLAGAVSGPYPVHIKSIRRFSSLTIMVYAGVAVTLISKLDNLRRRGPILDDNQVGDTCTTNGNAKRTKDAGINPCLSQTIIPQRSIDSYHMRDQTSQMVYVPSFVPHLVDSVLMVIPRMFGSVSSLRQNNEIKREPASDAPSISCAIWESCLTPLNLSNGSQRKLFSATGRRSDDFPFTSKKDASAKSLDSSYFTRDKNDKLKAQTVGKMSVPLEVDKYITRLPGCMCALLSVPDLCV